MTSASGACPTPSRRTRPSRPTARRSGPSSRRPSRRPRAKYQVSIETLREARTAIKSLQEKVAKAYPQGTQNRDQSDNFLKALYGLTKMLEDPNVEQFLKGLDRYPTTTLGHLITFMHSFGLRFGAAKTPIQEATYDQLYPILVGLRDGSNAQGPNPITAQAPEPDPKTLTNFFSGMDYSHFQPQPKPTHPTSRPPPTQVSGMCDRDGCDPYVDISRVRTPSRIQEGSRILDVPVRPGRHPSGTRPLTTGRSLSTRAHRDRSRQRVACAPSSPIERTSS